MISQLATALNLPTNPVALLWSDSLPSEAKTLQPGKGGCVLTLFAQVALRGATAAFSRENYGCFGGGVGLGFGNCYHDFPGGVDCFCHFLSSGNRHSHAGNVIGEKMAATGASHFARTFLEGERYVKNPAITRRFVEALPMREIPKRYVVVSPLSICERELDDIRSITLFVNADQLAALVVLANYLHPERENVGVPWGAACQVAGIFAYREMDREHPRALLGLTDISARKYTRSSLGKDMLAMTLPLPKFLEMESCVTDSFLEGKLWQSLVKD